MSYTIIPRSVLADEQTIINSQGTISAPLLRVLPDTIVDNAQKILFLEAHNSLVSRDYELAQVDIFNTSVGRRSTVNTGSTTMNFLNSAYLNSINPENSPNNTVVRTSDVNNLSYNFSLTDANNNNFFLRSINIFSSFTGMGTVQIRLNENLLVSPILTSTIIAPNNVLLPFVLLAPNITHTINLITSTGSVLPAHTTTHTDTTLNGFRVFSSAFPAPARHSTTPNTFPFLTYGVFGDTRALNRLLRININSRLQTNGKNVLLYIDEELNRNLGVRLANGSSEVFGTTGQFIRPNFNATHFDILGVAGQQANINGYVLFVW